MRSRRKAASRMATSLSTRSDVDGNLASPRAKSKGPVPFASFSASEIARQREGEGVVAEAHAIDLEVLEDALNVVSRFGEGDRLDPVDDIDVLCAGIAKIIHPLADARRPG